MNTMTSADFLAALRQGNCVFEKVQITGNADFGDMKLDQLALHDVRFSGEVEGYVTVDTISIKGNGVYFVSFRASTYTASCLKDLAHS